MISAGTGHFYPDIQYESSHTGCHQEQKFCETCGIQFLRQIHQPSPEEQFVLAMLKSDEAHNDGELYAWIRSLLREMRGATRCTPCRLAPLTLAERIR